MKKKPEQGKAKSGERRESRAGNAAIFYHPEGYTVSTDGKLMGRHAAGEGFLNGFFRHAQVDCFYGYAASREHYNLFQQSAAVLAGNVETVWIPHTTPDQISAPGAVYVPGPDLAELAWKRRSSDAQSWSITGVTHTICSDRIMDALCNLMLAPVEPWDAIICTSRVVKSSIERLTDGYGEYLKERMDARVLDKKIQLPIIPLGVDCDAFAKSQQTDQARRQLRKELGIGDNDIVALFMGRFSFHAKAHPLPMYMGLESAARATGKKIWLVQAGWFPNDHIKQEFVNGARQFCPSVQNLFVDGRKPEVRRNIWFVADIFISLPDNIQETFGITPVEAMAAGLPAVVTDWNGYKDTVEEGVTGFRVPTFMPEAGTGEELASRFFYGVDTYDRYIGLSSQCIAVDIGATAQALTELARNDDLRRRMGENGIKRAREVYDWRVIIRQYQDLWAELASRRASAGVVPGASRTLPHRPDPFRLFDDYPTQVVGGDTTISINVNTPEKALRVMLKLNMNSFAMSILLGESEFKKIFSRLGEQNKITVAELLADFPADRQAALQRTITWLAKLGIVKIEG